MKTLLLVALSLLGGQEDLLKDLGHTKYFAREKATKKLQSKMDFTLYLELRTFKTSDPEVANRINLVMSEWSHKFTLKAMDVYKADLQGYPEYPWIDSLPKGYHWKGFERWPIIQGYLAYANEKGAPSDSHPKWTNYRVATKLWLEARIAWDIQDCLNQCDCEPDFKTLMSCRAKSIAKDIALMIEGDDRQCVDLNVPKLKREGKK